ncbi:MAG: hypothetical protein PHR11_04090, partial [Candidatus Omnitrophica bacterium]|nr:hypothetical protein [Candidatus Omnitrophota bacterium]
IKQQVAVLEEEKKGLQQDMEKEQALKNQISQDNASLKESLRLSDEKLAALVHDLSEAHRNLEELSAQISIVTAENTALKEDFTRTKARLEEESRQKDELAARFNSVTELKKAIKDLRKRMRQARQLAAPLRPPKKTAAGETEGKIIDGNRGYLIKDGKPTTPTKVKIEVITLP